MLTDKHVQYAKKNYEHNCCFHFLLNKWENGPGGLEHANFKHVTILEYDIASRTNGAFIFNF